MRQSSCRCVAKENDIAVAKVIDKRRGERLVCIYHRDEQENYNLNNLVELFHRSLVLNHRIYNF